MAETKTYTTKLFRSFQSIDASSYKSILLFVEENQTKLDALPANEYFELMYKYFIALHETGKYKKVISLSRELIELSLLENIKEINGVDVLASVMFRKSEAFFNLLDFDNCLKSCDELLRIFPSNKEGALLYEKALYHAKNSMVNKSRGLAIVMFILSAFIIGYEVFIAVYFQPDIVDSFEIVRNSTLIAGWVILLGGDVLHLTRSWLKTYLLVSRYKKRKKQKGKM